MPWKNGNRWVYSITYDEGCEDLLKYALPLHRRFEIPGHVALVASQIGVRRNVSGSSYDGMMILSREPIRSLVEEGWGVSCHGMNHVQITEENLQLELFDSRALLSETLGMDITMFCLPGNNSHYEIVHKHAQQAGYAANLTIYDDVNTSQTDLLRLCRCPLHTEYPPPFNSAFDPYKRIHQAIDCGGWIIDYCHCPTPDKPIHPQKDCTTQELRKRFETIRRIGGKDVWLAEPNEVVRFLQEKKE